MTIACIIEGVQPKCNNLKCLVKPVAIYGKEMSNYDFPKLSSQLILKDVEHFLLILLLLLFYNITVYKFYRKAKSVIFSTILITYIGILNSYKQRDHYFNLVILDRVFNLLTSMIKSPHLKKCGKVLPNISSK